MVSNIDDDLLAAPLGLTFDPSAPPRRQGLQAGRFFRYLIEHAGCGRDDILHSGQSQFTDLVGGKPLGLTIAWINRRGIALHASVPKPDYEFRDVVPLLGLVAS